MLQTLNRTLEKRMPVITPVGVILGILLSSYVKDFTYLIPWLFAFMTFEGSLSMNFRNLKGAISHPLPVFAILGFLHIIMPLWTWVIAHLTFPGDSFTMTGLILGMVVPTGITSFIWVSMKRGNQALTLGVIIIDAILSPFIVPFSLSMLVGQKVELAIFPMMTGLFFMIVLPSVVALLLNGYTRGKIAKVWKPHLAPFSKLFIGLIVLLNGAEVAPYFQTIDWKLLFIIVTVLFIAFTGYVFAFLLAKWFKFPRDTVVSVTFGGGMRNISAGAVIAVTYFPAAVVLPVVVGMLFQQSLASLFGTFLDQAFGKNDMKKQATA